MQINFCPRCGTAVEQLERFGKLRPVCPACHYVHFDDPKVAAVTFLQQDKSVLLVRRGIEPELGKWVLPAGYVDFGEDPQATAIRETEEETGLVINIDRLIDVLFNPPVIVITYAATILGGTLAAGDDACEVGWFTSDNLPDIAFESTRRIIERWRSGTL